MTLQRVSNAYVEGNRGSAVLSFIGNGLRIATVSGGTTVEYTEGGITWRHHEIRSGTSSLEIQVPGWVETILLMGGGGDGGITQSGYSGGGGGAGGVYFIRWGYLTPQTISATIGANRANSTVTIAGYGTTPGSTITCGFGGNGGNGGSGGGGAAAGAGSNGGGNGGEGGISAKPGGSATGGTSTLTNFYLNRSNSAYGIANAGGTANTGNGGSPSGGAGGSGVFIIRYPLVTF